MQSGRFWTLRSGFDIEIDIIKKILPGSTCPPVFEFHFLKVSRLEVAEQKKIIPAHASMVMMPIFENYENFRKSGAGGGLRLVKS